MYKIKAKVDFVNVQNQGEKQEIETKVQNQFRSNAYVTNFYVKNQISKSGNLFECLKHKTKCKSVSLF